VDGPTFELTPDMRAGFLALLARRGVTLDERTVASVQGFLDEQIGYEIAQLSFGRTGGIRRLFDVDPVLEQAQQFASKARTPSDLLTLAQSAAAAPAPRP
jgi:hypothetical protein